MVWGKNQKDARKTKRFRINGKAFAAFFNPSEDFVKMGEILDISEAGVGLRYVGINEQTGESSQLEIFDSDEQLQVGKLPCRVVYDMELIDESQGLLKVRRCGVQFFKLSEEQMAALRAFIETHKLEEGTEPPDGDAQPVDR